jgi:hypothetical protein
VFLLIIMVEKKQRFSFVNNHDTALTAKPDPEIPKKRSRKERSSSNSSEESRERAKKRQKKSHKHKKRVSSSSDSSESSGDDEQSRIRNAAIAQIADKFNYKGDVKPERDVKKDEPAPKVN